MATSRKKKRAEVDEDADEHMTGDEAPAGADAAGARGTVLVTLRNVAPYTDWSVYISQICAGLILTCLSGIFPG